MEQIPYIVHEAADREASQKHFVQVYEKIGQDVKINISYFS